MLAAHPELSTLVGIDMDPTAHAIASARLQARCPAAAVHRLPAAPPGTGATAGAAASPAPAGAGAAIAGAAVPAAAGAAAGGGGPHCWLVQGNFDGVEAILERGLPGVLRLLIVM